MADCACVVALLLALVLCSVGFVCGLRVQAFFPLEDTDGDSKLLAAKTSVPIELKTTYNFYRKPYSSLQVHVDGIITLGSPTVLDSPSLRRKFLFPPYLKVIAPFYAPAYTSNTSKVSYYESRDSGLLSRATRDVRTSFAEEQDFNATAIFVATWNQVKHTHHRHAQKSNTFQAVLITDGAETFVLYNYATEGLQWTKGYHVYWQDRRTTYAQSGFSAGDFVRYYSLPGSGKDDVHLLTSKSNMMSPGQWMYKVGWPTMHGLEVQPADSYMSIIPDFIAEQFFSGCYVVHGYLASNRSLVWSDVSIRSCMALCYQRRIRYAALHKGNECACLSDITDLVVTSDDKCDMKCAVAQSEFCGGQATASVYKAVARAAVQSDQSNGIAQLEDINECVQDVGRCHSNATCTNTSPGYCCRCNSGYYGNGIACIKMGAVQRMIGFLTGNLNGQALGNHHMDTVAFSDDGRVYVSIRSFPSSLAYSARVLIPIADATAWLYAKPKPTGFRNGLSVVGARFIRRAAVRFNSGEEVGIYQRYKGANHRTNYITVETEIRGTIPLIENEAIVHMGKIRQEFKRTGIGRIQSRGTVKYEVDGAEHAFTVDQTIDYDEPKGCGQHVDRGVFEADAISLRYDETQSFLVFAMKASFINATLDTIDVQGLEPAKPCGSKQTMCHKLGVCIHYRGDRECRCNYGYLGDGVTYCQDADECKLNRYRCSVDAKCINTIGSYKCVCKDGFKGDGQKCRKDTTKQCPRPCGAHAKCLQVAEGPTCICNLGYQGDGFDCQSDGTCDGVKCDVNAKCVKTHSKVRMCVCDAGYQGDGQKCTAVPVEKCGGVFCGKNAQCVSSKCVCNAGYLGNGQTCTDEDECQRNTHRCDPNAECLNSAGSYKCRCKDGYNGDGYKCEKDAKYCGDAKCHRFAVCRTNPSNGERLCKCRAGFRGDGVTCVDLDECIPVLNPCDRGHAMCRNTLGAYECVCKRGYVMKQGKCVGDGKCNGFKCEANAHCDAVQCVCNTGFEGVNGKQCTDVDECKMKPSRCDPNAECRNTLGSFTCRCKPGFEGDGFRCQVDNTCGGQICRANARCVTQSNGTRQCVCNDGYLGNGTTCLDLDECGTGKFSCPSNADCINTDGSYKCRCKKGFYENGSVCTADDICNGFKCDHNARCALVIRDIRECRCNAGWQKHGDRCVDENECRSGVNPCHPMADCFNSLGSFFCRCRSGFKGNGRFCNDVNECKTSPFICPANSGCLNTEGSYECRCKIGFIKKGTNCIEDTTCDGVVCGSNAKCLQSIGGARECVCKTGWEKSGNTCIDRDECRYNVNPCHPKANCRNTLGSYSCSCRPGFKGDGRFCEADGTCAGVNCHPDAICKQNGALGDTCECKPGYLGDGRKCADIDECARNKSGCHEHAMCKNTIGSFTCTCNLGYAGDGFNCTDDGTCQGVRCDPNAKCVATSPTSRTKKCLCNDGYQGNGAVCRDINECYLGHTRCHRKAECVNQVGSYRCRCVRGYVGDGTRCESDGTCEGKICDFNAVCITTNTSKGLDKQCQCKKGFDGDGILCKDINECNKNPCPAMAMCINGFGTFTCLCKAGYKEVNGRCKKICRRCQNGGTCVNKTECLCPKGYSGRQCQWYGLASLIYTKGNSVQRMSLPPRPGAIGLVFQQEGMLNVGLDYDCVEQYIYWTEVIEGCIMRAKYDGSNREVVLDRSQVKSPEGLAVDWIGRNLYWTDSALDVIEVSSLNGSNRRVLISNGIDDPRAILVDPLNGKMYWSDWTRRRPRIEVANMDGSSRHVLVYDESVLPNGLTLVQATNELCYTDAGSWSIRCVDLGGLNVRKVLARVAYPYGIAHYNRTLYWSNWYQNVVHRIGVNSVAPDSPISTFVGMNGKIFDVKVVQPCPAKAPKNPCAVSNGGCLGLCVLKSRGYTCICPNGQFLVKQENKTICKDKCGEALGLESGIISDAQMTASSARFNNHKRFGAHRARLNLDTWPSGWNAKTYDPSPWLQIDLRSEKTVTAIATQGFGHTASNEWVKTYKVASSDDGITWFVLEKDGREKIFIGNTDKNNIKRNKFPTPIRTRWLRVLPRTWYMHVSLRVELYGC